MNHPSIILVVPTERTTNAIDLDTYLEESEPAFLDELRKQTKLFNKTDKPFVFYVDGWSSCIREQINELRLTIEKTNQNNPGGGDQCIIVTQNPLFVKETIYYFHEWFGINFMNDYDDFMYVAMNYRKSKPEAERMSFVAVEPMHDKDMDPSDWEPFHDLDKTFGYFKVFGIAPRNGAYWLK
jgi:hypothetical protein